jgi:two-component system phosphate regulon response regulator PhoB
MSSAQPFILIAEDELTLGELLMFGLKGEGFEVELAGDGRLALSRLRKTPQPDLMLLDWMLPGPSGIEICKIARNNSALNKMPIMMLTARSDEEDIITGLEAGADDYLTKPFSMKVLTARIRALLRRTDDKENLDLLQFGTLTINPDTYCASWKEDPIPLSPTGFKLLFYFASNPNKVLTRDKVLDGVWGQDAAIEPRTVDANVKRVRTLLKKFTGQEFIKTSHGFGYVFAPY